MTNICTVLTGTKYSVDDVNKLYHSLQKHTTKEFNYYCYTDHTGFDDGVKVIYWASNSTGKLIDNPQEAYKNFNNAGIALVKEGKATIRIFCPDKYNVQKIMKKTLDKHFHYRVVCNKTGFVGPVQTFFVDC